MTYEGGGSCIPYFNTKLRKILYLFTASNISYFKYIFGFHPPSRVIYDQLG